MRLRLDYLNHASMLLSTGPVALLSDPWLEGTAFSGGWGLRYLRPDAVEVGARATHLWISHWHSDHLSMPSLAALARRNPSIRVLANVSANFSMVDRLRSAGFHDVVPFGERSTLDLGGGVSVTRFPTAGIDNMLHLRAPGWSVLNYNDCNLPANALAALRRTIGTVDLLLNNYNHAGKLFDRLSVDEQKQALWDVLLRATDIVGPSHVVPFASSHYYRTAVSRDQNASLLGFDELEERSRGDDRFCILRVGDALELDAPGATPRFERHEPPLPEQPRELHDYGASVPWDALLGIASRRCRGLDRSFFGAARLLPPLRVRVSDLDRVLVLRAGAEAREATPGEGPPHIGAHSVAVADWLGRQFGDDTFVAGAHFALIDPDTGPIRHWALVTLLEASHLDLRSVTRFLRSPEGVRFLWWRREEIAATVLGGRFRAGQIRL